MQPPAVQVLRKVWVDQYVEEDGQLRWRSKAEMPAPASQVSSPYDPAARYRTKRDISWVGYKVHLTETCDPELAAHYNERRNPRRLRLRMTIWWLWCTSRWSSTRCCRDVDGVRARADKVAGGAEGDVCNNARAV